MNISYPFTSHYNDSEKMTSTYKYRQIRIDKELYLLIKRHCVITEKKITTFFSDVIEWFFGQGRHKSTIIYRASRQNGHPMTIRLPNYTTHLVSILATQENVSDARVIFTALTLYMENHHL
jgi:hypothetical protein